MRRKNIGKRGPNPPSSIGAVLQEKQQQLFKYRPVWNSWASAVGSQVAGHAQPDAIQKNGLLIVRVDSSGWMQELQFLKTSLIDSLNCICGNNVIKDIQFRIGTLLPPKTPQEKTHVRREISPLCRLDAQGVTTIREKARYVHDPELLAIIERISKKLSSGDR